MKYTITVGFWQLNTCQVEVECDGPLTPEVCQAAIGEAGDLEAEWEFAVDTRASHIESASDVFGNHADVPAGFHSEVIAE